MVVFFGPGAEGVPIDAGADHGVIHELDAPHGSLCWLEQSVEPGEPAGDVRAGDVRAGDVYEEPERSNEPAKMVRPYAWTGGRTRPRYEFRWETLVSTTPLGGHQTSWSQPEHRAVAVLCRQPQSVVEVAAGLSIPVGVAKVILGDMAELGLIRIHSTSGGDAVAAHLELMERVLSGLRRL